MPVQIGAKAHDFSEPTGLLSDCHRRIEMFLGSLHRVGQVIDSPLTSDTRTALESALRYFHESAPKHTQDEEESLFPRLRQIHRPEIEVALTILDSLEGDHQRASVLHDEVDALGQQCLESGQLASREAARFRAAISDLALIYGEHIRIEDSIVFPAAQRVLSNLQKSAIAEEMVSRRNLPKLTGPS